MGQTTEAIMGREKEKKLRAEFVGDRKCRSVRYEVLTLRVLSWRFVGRSIDPAVYRG